MPPPVKPRKRESRAANPTDQPAATALSVSRSRSKACKSGKRGEAIVAEYHQVAHAGKVVHLFHVPTDTIRVKRGKSWSIIYRSKSTVDSVGYMFDGRAACEEIKTCTASKTFYLREVELHQRAYLDAVHEVGGVAALTVVYGEAKDVCVIPWQIARVQSKFTGEELLEYKVLPYQYFRRFMKGEPLPQCVGFIELGHAGLRIDFEGEVAQ